MFDRAEQDKDRAGQVRTGRCRIMTGKAAFLGCTPSDMLVDRSGVSAIPICQIRQRTFVWLNFLTLEKNIKKISIISF